MKWGGGGETEKEERGERKLKKENRRSKAKSRTGASGASRMLVGTAEASLLAVALGSHLCIPGAIGASCTFLSAARALASSWSHLSISRETAVCLDPPTQARTWMGTSYEPLGVLADRRSK